MEVEEDLIYSPKKNWHDRKKWNDGIHTRRSVRRWVSTDEEITITETGTPLLTYPCVSRESGYKEWIYDTVAIRSAANIENYWLRKFRHHNDKGGKNYYTTANFVTGKSSRMGMKEKARWWQEVYKYYDELQYDDDIAA